MNRFGAAKVAELMTRFEWGALSPGTLPDGLPMLLALTPPVAAGLIIFRLPAAEFLCIALAAGVLALVAQRVIHLRPQVPLLLAPLFAVAFVGAAANLFWVSGLAVVAAALELLRARFLPAARVNTGLLVYCAGLLVGSSALAAYLRPGEMHLRPEPVALWLHFYGGSAAPIDPIRLYVGNVAGPVFATSLLAIAVSLVWLWYTHRLRLLVLGGFLLGALVPALVMGWNPVYQLDSGPAWFVAGFVLADAAMVRHSRPAQVLMGVAVGLAGVGLRSRGAGIEAMAVAAVAIQLVVAATEGAAWLIGRRRVVLSRVPGWLSSLGRVSLRPVRRSGDHQLSD